MFFPVFTMLLAGTVAEANRSDRNEVKGTIQAWVEATDAQNADRVAEVFLPDAVQRVRLGDKEMSLTTEAYVGMIRAGKVGGTRTSLVIHDIEVADGLATALTTRTSDAMVMRDALVLERTDTGWRVASASVRATPR